MRQPEDASFDHGGRDGMVDLRGILLALRGRIRTILAVTVTVAIAATIFVFVATPRYAGESQLLLENRDSVFTRTLSERELPGGVIDEQAVLSQVQVVTSREVAREVIRRLELVGNAEFDPLVGPMDPITRVRTLLGIAAGESARHEEDRIFDAYYRALTVYAVPRSRVLAIEFRSQDPDLSALAANTIAEVYLEELEEAQAELARAASNWLGANIEDLRARVSEAEAAVESFRTSSRLFLSGDSANISSQQLSDLNSRLAEARSTQADSEARAQLISDMIEEGRAFEIPDVASNELIARLIEQRIDLRSQIALEQRTLLPGHPRILELRAQLSDLDEQITASAERTVRILENEARIAASRVASLEGALDAQMSVVAQANESEVQLRALEREARAEREQLENYLTRYREAIARGSQNATLPDARIVSRAVVPNDPVFPRKAPTIVLATLGAAFVATGGVVVAALVSGGGPAAPAMAGGYGYAMHRRDIYPANQDDAYGDAGHSVYAGAGDDPMPMNPGIRARMPVYAQSNYSMPGYAMPGHAAAGSAATSRPAGVAGRAAVGAALAEDLHTRAAERPQMHADEYGHESAGVRDPETARTTEFPTDEAQSSAGPRREAFVDTSVQPPPVEEGVLSGVRKVGARLRGTLAPIGDADEAAARSHDAHARPASREHDDAAVATPRESLPHAKSDRASGATEAPEPFAAQEAALPEPLQQESPSQAGLMDETPERRSQADDAQDSLAEEGQGHAVAGRDTSIDQRAEDAEPRRDERKPAAQADHAACEPAGATQTASAPKKSMPDNWQDLVAESPDADPETTVEAPAEAVAGKAKAAIRSRTRTENSDTAVRHEPRLRRKYAARAAAADPVEDEAGESRLDAAWQEAEGTLDSAHAPISAPTASRDTADEPVPVLDDGPAKADSVPVPTRAEAEPEAASRAIAAADPAPASENAEAGYDFSALLNRLQQNQRQDRGQRILVSGLGDTKRLRRFGEALAQAGSRKGRCILIATQDDGRPATAPGLSDLIAERASFFDVIQRDPGSSLHRVEKGRDDLAGLRNADDDGLDIALTAFQHTYGLVFMLMPDPEDADLLRRLAGAADTIVIAADREADDPELVDLYARLAGMGTADVVVAGVGCRAGVAAA